MTPEVWDYIFLEGAPPQNSAIAPDTLAAMRREFLFWYPFDLRVRCLLPIYTLVSPCCSFVTHQICANDVSLHLCLVWLHSAYEVHSRWYLCLVFGSFKLVPLHHNRILIRKECPVWRSNIIGPLSSCSVQKGITVQISSKIER